MRFMQGRYGVDKLDRALIVVALAIYAVSLFFRRTVYPYAILNALYILLIAGAVFRAFSRNFYKRQQELAKYMALENRVVTWWRNLRNRTKGNVIDIKAHKEYKYLSCPQCMQRLRVPRGKGKLRVTCTKCGWKRKWKSTRT